MFRVRAQGYVLLIVLVTLTIAAAALTQVATRALRQNSDSLARQRGLQTRWGRISCQRAMLRTADRIFESLESVPPSRNRDLREPKLSAFNESVELGGQMFTLILADESAKVNLNAVARAGGTNKLVDVLRKILKPNHFQCVRRLDGLSPTGLGSWGELFDLNKLREIEGSDRALAEMARELTLWGSGKLNIHRASDVALEVVCKSVVTDGLARRIVERIHESAQLETELLLRQTVVNEADRRQLETLLGEGSAAFSLWVETFDGTARFQHFAVTFSDDTGKQVTLEFSLN